MTITRPQNIDFLDWSKQLGLDYPEVGVIPSVHSESEWQEWAQSLQRLPLISRFNPPDPMAFANWQEWAQFFVKAITQ